MRDELERSKASVCERDAQLSEQQTALAQAAEAKRSLEEQLAAARARADALSTQLSAAHEATRAAYDDDLARSEGA